MVRAEDKMRSSNERAAQSMIAARVEAASLTNELDSARVDADQHRVSGVGVDRVAKEDCCGMGDVQNVRDSLRTLYGSCIARAAGWRQSVQAVLDLHKRIGPLIAADVAQR